MEEADQLCDRVAIIDRGELKVLDTPQNLKARLGGDVITVVLTDSSEAASERARNLFAGFDWISRVDAHPQGLVLIASNGDAAIPRLVQAASENGLQIASLALKRPLLDDVFLTYTGRELREEEGGADAFRRMSRGVRQARS
jgi:ABC-2 type transport system ATP-binding protein